MAKLLLVDDDPHIVSIFQRLLLRVERGFSIRTASSAEQALLMLAEEPADVVLTDVRMPGMDGLELLAQIRSLYPQTMIIVMTAYGSEAAVKAQQGGAWAFLRKPFSAKELLRIVREALKNAP